MFRKIKRALGRPSLRIAPTLVTEKEESAVTEERVEDVEYSGRPSGCTGRFWRRGRKVIPAFVEESVPATLPSVSASKVQDDKTSKGKNDPAAVSPSVAKKELGPTTSILRHSLKGSLAQTNLIQVDTDSEDDDAIEAAAADEANTTDVEEDAKPSLRSSTAVTSLAILDRKTIKKQKKEEEKDEEAKEMEQGVRSSPVRKASLKSSTAVTNLACLDRKTVRKQNEEDDEDEEKDEEAEERGHGVHSSHVRKASLKRSPASTNLFSDDETLSYTSEMIAEPDTEAETPDEPFPRSGTRISWNSEASMRIIPRRKKPPREEPPVVLPLDQPRPSQPKEPNIGDLLCCCFIPFHKKLTANRTPSHARKQQLKDLRRRSEKRR